MLRVETDEQKIISGQFPCSSGPFAEDRLPIMGPGPGPRAIERPRHQGAMVTLLLLDRAGQSQ
jgi:hypothetical protein